MQFNYNTTVPQGGIGGDFPNQIQALRTAQAPTVAKAAFNAPVYQRARMTPQQQMGMNRNMADQFRTGTWQQANNLQRATNLLTSRCECSRCNRPIRR